VSLQKTSLHEKHLRLNAKMGPFAGFEMPLQYSGVKDEVLAVRNNIGVFDVGHMGEFFIEGTEAQQFVDYLITNDFLGAGESKAVYSPLCREDGTVVDDAISYKVRPDKVLICVNASNMQKDWTWISSHVNAFNCTITDKSAEYSLLAVQGPKTEALFIKLGLLSPQENFPYYSVKEGKYLGKEVIIARTGYTGEDGFEVFCSHDTAVNFWDTLLDNGVIPCGLVARDVLRLEVCFPLYGHELTDDLTPIDSGLKWTVKFNKTNFLGKNFLTNYKPKYILVKLSIEKGVPRQDYPVTTEDGRVIGKVVSGTMSISINHGVATALISEELFPKDKQFFINIREKLVRANYHTKPFVVGGHK